MHSKLISGTWLFNHYDVINNTAVLAKYLFVFSTECDQHPIVNNDDIIIPGRSHPLGAASTTKINRTTIRIYSRLFLNHFFCCGCSLLSIYIRFLFVLVSITILWLISFVLQRFTIWRYVMKCVFCLLFYHLTLNLFNELQPFSSLIVLQPFHFIGVSLCKMTF